MGHIKETLIMLRVSSFKLREKGFTLTPKFGVTCRRQGGFTLMEAIVAVSVFAIAATSIVGVYLSVQRLNQASAALQALQQNGRFMTEDITKVVRNGQVDYARYGGGGVPQPATPHLYLLDRDRVQIDIYQSGNNLVLDKLGVGSTNFSGTEVAIKNFQVYVSPAANPFAGGAVKEQPTVTLYLDLESNINARDKTRYVLQTTVATRQYPQ